MSLQQIKKELRELRGALNPGNPAAQIVIYDRKGRDSPDISLDCITVINSKDVTAFTDAEKANELSKSQVHFYLPEKDELP